MYVEFTNFLNERDLNLELLFSYGSQVYNLDNASSDYDLMAVVSQQPDTYLGLHDANRSWGHFTHDNVTVQFLDLKRFYQLAESSNFTLYVGLRNLTFTAPLQLPNPRTFSLRKLAHHCLGLVDNKSQRQYMKAYSALFVMFLVQNGHHPASLDYRYLLDNVRSVPDNVKRLLELKKTGEAKLSDVAVNAPYTHDEVNFLSDEKHSYNDFWLDWLKERYVF